MTFLTPLLAGIVGAIAVPSLVILYFLKLRRRDVEVSTTLLWKKAIEDLQANAPFQRLRNNILLYLQLLALLAAIFALAQPQLRSDLSEGTNHVILIDTSASMGATDGDPDDPSARETRLERAKAEALKLVDSLREPGVLGTAGDRAMVISFDTSANPRQNFTTSKGELRAAIEKIKPTDAPTSLREALKLAKAYSPRVTDKDLIEKMGRLGSVGPPAVIHIFSDGRFPDASRIAENPRETVDITAEDNVVYHRVGRTDAENLGIVALRAERAFNRPNELSILVSVQSTSRRVRTADVQLSMEGRVVGVKELVLPAATVPNAPASAAAAAPGAAPGSGASPAPGIVPATNGVVFRLDRSDGGVVTAQLLLKQEGDESARDVLPADDVGYISVPPAKRLRIALVTPGNPVLVDLLEGLNLGKLDVLSTSAGQALLDSKRAGEYDVFILDRWLPEVKPAPGALADAKPGPGLPAGRFLVYGIVPPPPLGMTTLGPSPDTGLMVDWLRDHPTLRHVGFETTLISEAVKTEIRDGSTATILALAQTGPAIIEASDAQTRAVVVAFDPLRSNWPLNDGFVVFNAAAIRYLGSDGAAAADVSVQPGEPISQRIPPAARKVTIGLPDKSTADLSPSADGRVLFGPIQRVGIYTLSWEGPPGSQDVEVEGRVRRAIAANLLDSKESDVAASSVPPIPAANVTVTEGGPGGGARKLWPWLLLAVVAFLLFEWWVYNRKVAF